MPCNLFSPVPGLAALRHRPPLCGDGGDRSAAHPTQGCVSRPGSGRHSRRTAALPPPQPKAAAAVAQPTPPPPLGLAPGPLSEHVAVPLQLCASLP